MKVASIVNLEHNGNYPYIRKAKISRMSDDQICSNCDNHFTGDFCNRCGQKTVHRITMAHLGHEMVHAFTHTDKGFFHLLIKMFVKPGIVAREYIAEGKRKRYFTPFQYLLIIGTIAAFVAANSHFLESTTAALGGTDVYSSRQLALMQKITGYQTRYYNFIILLQLPFYALATSVIYQKYRYNFAELLTLQTFVSAQTTLIATVIMLSIFVIGKAGSTMVMVIGFINMCFHVFAYMQFFAEKSVKGFFKALLTNCIGILLFVLFMMLLVLLFGLATSAFMS